MHDAQAPLPLSNAALFRLWGEHMRRGDVQAARAVLRRVVVRQGKGGES